MSVAPKKRRPAWIWAGSAGALAFATLLALDHDRYLRHERWIDYRLTYSTPTEGGEFVSAADGLELNPQIGERLERRLDADGMAALRAGIAQPVWRKERRFDWMTRVCSVYLEKPTHPFTVRVRVHHFDPAAAERIARTVSDEVLQFGSLLQFERERGAELRRLEKELRDNGGVMSSELREKFRAASGGSWLSLQHISRVDRFSPRASAGKIVIWRRLAEAMLQATILAVPSGLLMALVVRWRREAK